MPTKNPIRLTAPSDTHDDILSAMANHTKYVRSISPLPDVEKTYHASLNGIGNHQLSPPLAATLSSSEAGPSRPHRPLRSSGLGGGGPGGGRGGGGYTIRNTSLADQMTYDLELLGDGVGRVWRVSKSKTKRRKGLFTIGLVVGVLVTMTLGCTVLFNWKPTVAVEVLGNGWVKIQRIADPWHPTLEIEEAYQPTPIFHDDADRLHNVMPVPGDFSHVLVPVTDLFAPTPLLTPIPRLPHDLMMQYYIHGTVPVMDSPVETNGLDIVYLYVNGSSSYLEKAKGLKLQEEGISLRGKARHWRDNGELRGSIRAAVQALGDGLDKIHVVAGNYDFDHAEYKHLLPYKQAVRPDVDVLGWKMGQVPDWLDWKAVSRGHGKLTFHFHDEVFRLPRDDGRLDSKVLKAGHRIEQEWRKEALPSFDSFEIESRIGWIESLGQNIILSNDDMFIMTSMEVADFHHPILGTVFRFDPSPRLLVQPVIQNNLKSDGGEWGGLKYASSLVSRRFPSKGRMYMHHIPKSLTKSLLHETSIIFAEDLTVAATRSFRESKRGIADVEMSWLVSHVGVERWREALLWVWAVVKVGGINGEWGEEAREELRRIFNLDKGQEGEFATIVKPERQTLFDIGEISGNAGWEPPKATHYEFSSMDGHITAGPVKKDTTCVFHYTKCLSGDFFTSTSSLPADEVFKHLAFNAPDCGDCLIDALIGASGERGLSMILPNEHQVFYPPEREPRIWDRNEPMLPLTPTWQEANFTMADIVRPGQDQWEGVSLLEDGGVRLLDWSVKLLSRYAYLQGSSVMEFTQVRNARQLNTALRKIDAALNMALFCINDDQPDTTNGHPVKDALEKWMTDKWGKVQVDWERSETLDPADDFD